MHGSHFETVQETDVSHLLNIGLIPLSVSEIFRSIREFEKSEPSEIDDEPKRRFDSIVPPEVFKK